MTDEERVNVTTTTSISTAPEPDKKPKKEAKTRKATASKPKAAPKPKSAPKPKVKDIAELNLGQRFKFGNKIGRLTNRRTDTGELMHCAAELEPIPGVKNGYNQVGTIKLPSGTMVTVIS